MGFEPCVLADERLGRRDEHRAKPHIVGVAVRHQLTGVLLTLTDEKTNAPPFGDASVFWPARRDSNPRPLESESTAISSFATGGGMARTRCVRASVIVH